METQIPETAFACAGCEKPGNVLSPYLHVMLKPQREVLSLRDIEDEDNSEIVGQEVSLGVRAGRGVLLKFHDFDCLGKWVAARKGLSPKLEAHSEDEIYVPEDNPDDKEIARRARAAEKLAEEGGNG